MTEKILTVLRSLWAYLLSWKSWTVTKIGAFKMTLTVTGWNIVVIGLVSLVVVLTAYWTGKLSVRQAKSYMVSLLQPEARTLALPSAPMPTDANIALITDNAKLEAENADLRQALSDMTAIAQAKHNRLLAAETEMAQHRAEPLEVAKCVPKVRYVRVKEKTFLCDVAGMCK